MASSQASVTVASLMLRLRSGDCEAAGELFTALYLELRRLAAAKMSTEASDHSWQPSLLVNELYLQSIKVKSLPGPESSTRSEREHFLQFADVMRHLLIDHARRSHPGALPGSILQIST